MSNDADNPRVKPQLTEYEQKLLESLRAERRGRAGMAALPPAPAPVPFEPPEAGPEENVVESPSVAQPEVASREPEPVEHAPQLFAASASRYKPSASAEVPPSRVERPMRRHIPPQPVAESSRWRPEPTGRAGRRPRRVQQTERRLADHFGGGSVTWITIAGDLGPDCLTRIGRAEKTKIEVARQLLLRCRSLSRLR